MIDIFNLPNTDLNTQVFYTTGGLNGWSTWEKPKNCKFVTFYVVGSGAGGSGGASGIISSTRIGGGGGGSSAISRGVYPSNLLPDTLYIQVGTGGIGGSAGVKGGDGQLSYVSIQPNTTTTNIILASGAVAASGGTSTGTGGVASTIFAQTGGLLSYLGTNQFIAGQAGGAGGSAAVGGNITLSLPVTGGAGGGGCGNNTSFSGGNITGSGIIPTVTGGGTSGSTIANNGYFTALPSANSSMSRPMFFTGGAGGGGAANLSGQAGGNGSFGSGGAGGGAGLTGGTGGIGGDGIVIITAW